jgi:hypothetical protein
MPRLATRSVVSLPPAEKDFPEGRRKKAKIYSFIMLLTGKR